MECSKSVCQRRRRVEERSQFRLLNKFIVAGCSRQLIRTPIMPTIVEQEENQLTVPETQDEQVKIPDTLPILPLRDIVIFPFMIVPLFVSRERSIKAVDQAL